MNLIAESALTTSGKPAIAFDYLWFGGRSVAQLDSGGAHYAFGDHLGTPLAQMGSSGTISYQAEYEPHGKIFALRSGDVHQPLRLPGQVAEQFDTGANGATERSYNVFRWYRPGWGRYWQADSSGIAGGLNLFGYSGANPIALTDPLGLQDVYIGEKRVEKVRWEFRPFRNWPTPVHVFLIVDPMNWLRTHPRDWGYRCLFFIAGTGEPQRLWGGFLNYSNNPEKSMIPLVRINPPENESPAAFGTDLITRAEHYPNGYFAYFAVPNLYLPGLGYIDKWGAYNTYNSAGFVVGLLTAAGVSDARGLVNGLPYHQFGADYPVSPGFFPGDAEPSKTISRSGCDCH
ncbi:MAG TPA: RHS repeat-associated core domain-containing protein [Candidatus Tumulicola sp.]|nr:RHS repeat-associated core domain-containing protein [Candidatus Tumulicola sp.]